MTSWPSTSLEQLIYTLIGLAAWQWAILTALWALLFPKSKVGLVQDKPGHWKLNQIDRRIK